KPLKPNMFRQLVALALVAVVAMTSVEAISCQDQAGSKGVRCVAKGTSCPSGFRPVFYDTPYPCRSGQRCCI
ncbi:hypothetical protein BX616_001107, partial [Lobosporangium transversale]